MTQSTASIVVRKGQPSDWPLLCTSFANYYCKNPHSYYGYRVPPHTLVSKLEQFKTAPSWQLSTACPGDASDEVLGMLLFQSGDKQANRNPAIAWITTKPLYQRKGVAKALLKVAAIPKGDVDCAFMLHNVANSRNGQWERLGSLTEWAEQGGYTLRFRPYLPDIELWNELNAVTPAKE